MPMNSRIHAFLDVAECCVVRLMKITLPIKSCRVWNVHLWGLLAGDWHVAGLRVVAVKSRIYLYWLELS